MGDHRVSLKVDFHMHGHEAKIDQWVNYTPDYVEKTADWLRRQIEIAMDRYMDAEYDRDMARNAEVEDAERKELERLKAKYEPDK